MKHGQLALNDDTPVLVINSGAGSNKLVANLITRKRVYIGSEFLKPMPETLSRTQISQLLEGLPKSIWQFSSYGNGKTGTDPEIFAFTGKGELIPAWNFLKTPKENPIAYWDGVQGEITTTPSHCHSYVTDSIHRNLKNLYQQLMKVDPGAQLVTQDVVKMPKELLLMAADEHINLGCSPSKNAYGTKPINIKDPRKHKYRYAGCHLHHSDEASPTPDWFPNGTVVMMDKTVGVLLTALGRDLENPIRRKAYGKPGEYRVPENGRQNRLEYRVPGAFILHHPALFNFAADMSRAGYRMGLLADGRTLDLPDVRDIITECDADMAVKYIKKYKDMFNAMFKFGITEVNSYDTEKTMDIVEKGAKAAGLFPESVIQNWHLTKSDWITHNGNNTNTWASAIQYY